MPRIPAVCDDCGAVFPSGFDLQSGAGNVFSGCGGGPCPRCGASSSILEGVYSVVENSVRVLRKTNRSASDIEALIKAVTQAQIDKAPASNIQILINQYAPELNQTLITDWKANLKHKPEGNSIKYTAIIISILSLILAALQRYAPLPAPAQSTPKTETSRTQTEPRPNRHQRRAQKKISPHK